MSATTTLAPPANGATVAAAGAKPPARPYRDFLTPCLHRHFTGAAMVVVPLCYAASVLMAPLSHWFLWALSPIGPTGIRTGAVFVSVLTILIVRIANLRTAARRAPSLAHGVARTLFSRSAPKTLLWYLLSAWLFVEVYIHSTDPSKELSIIDNTRPYERSHLNERPILLRTLFLLLAVYQSAYHIACDLDEVRNPSFRHEQDLQQEEGPARMVLGKAGRILQHTVTTTLLTTVIGFITYLFFRQWIWSVSFYGTKLVFSNMPKYQKTSTFPPFIGDLILVYLFWSAILTTIWGFSNVAFNTYLAQTPLDKKGRPLSGGSKDPNGSLLNGLKSKREFVVASAFSELSMIARTNPRRRQTLFRELDRAGGSTWTQLVTICLAQLQGVSKRINDYMNPPPAVPDPALPEQTAAPIYHLPRIAPPVKTDNVYAAPSPSKHPHIAAFGSFARQAGSHPEQSKPLTPRAKKAFSFTIDRFLSPEQQQAFSESHIAQLLKHYFTEFVKLPYVGFPFRQTFARRVAAVVISEPSRGGSSLSQLINAITSLAFLAVSASTEDTWGKASKDVATIIRTYTATITTIEDFLQKLEPHWTDVEFKGKKCEDVDDLVGVLKASLSRLLETYENYSELGLTFKEKRLARERSGLNRVQADPFTDAARADGMRPDMRERRRRPAGPV